MDETLLAVKVTALSLLPYQTKKTSSSSFEHLVSTSTVHSRGAHDSDVAAQTNRILLILDHVIICFNFLTKHHAVRIKSGHVVRSGFRHKHGL